MVEEDRYCIDVLTQIAAVTTALESLALPAARRPRPALRRRTRSPRATTAEAEAKAAELLEAVQRFAKTR